MTYPQLDIRRLDPHMSTDLADMVTGQFSFNGMSHEMRIMRLAAIKELYMAIMRLGDLEHTSDWDWRITVLYTPPDGSQVSRVAGTYDKGEDEYVWSDTYTLPFEVAPGDYTDGFTRWDHIIVEEYHEDHDQHVEVKVPVDAIRVLTIGQA